MISDLERARRRIANHPHIINTATGCKLARTCIQANGYVKLSFNYKWIYLHRLVAFVYLGLDLNNDKIQVCHIRECPHKHCFDEKHLYLGDAESNTNDFISTGEHHEKSKSLCDNGHELDRVMRTKRDGWVRYCSVCRREAQRRLRIRRGQKVRS